MRLTFLGKESVPDQSPTLYAGGTSYVVQGWIVTDPRVLTQLDIADDETVVEVPPRLMEHLAKDDLFGEVSNMVPPIVFVLENGNYVMKGKRVTDTEALSQMNIPDHETCIEVSKTAMAVLVGG
ncbi:MAG TPA: hypothetical protein DGG94_01545 [Micromonosporaceae bacterium]|nr:hypothetical protein [Micromonosporaceae bacterium]HCU48512.1 hypothetical protein [Micromonosporaceae bacterium]